MIAIYFIPKISLCSNVVLKSHNKLFYKRNNCKKKIIDAGMAKQEGCTSGSSSDFGNYLKHNNPLSKLYAVVKKPKTLTPIERHSAPSGDLYTIPSSGTTQQGENRHTSVYETADSTAFYEESNHDHQAEEVAKETSEWTATAQSTVKPAVAVKKFQDLSGETLHL